MRYGSITKRYDETKNRIGVVSQNTMKHLASFKMASVVKGRQEYCFSSRYIHI